MLRLSIRWLTRFNPFHAHRYELEVLPSKIVEGGDWEHATAEQMFPLEYRCSCGDKAVDGYDAIQRMSDSRLRRDVVVSVFVFAAFGIWAARTLMGQ